MVALRQFVEVGFTRQAIAKRAAAGRLRRRYRAVYVVGHHRLTAKGEWLAAVLAAGLTAVLSGRAALALYKVLPIPSGPVDVTVVTTGRRSPPGIRLHCVRALHPDDVTVVDGIPVTSVHRALLDYAATASLQQIRTALEAAERLELLDGRAMHALLDRSPGRATTKLRRALSELEGPAPWTQSELERRFLELVREAGLPEPQVNTSETAGPADFYWPSQRLIVEVDGWQWHRTRAQFEEDRRRDTQRALNGIRTIRLTQRRIAHERARVQHELTTLLGD